MALDVRIHTTRAAMGAAAAADIAAHVATRLARQPAVRMVFAAAPSQQEMLDALVAAPGIDWTRVHAFHMDEYAGLPSAAPQRFFNWLRVRLFDRLPFAAAHAFDPDRPDDYAACLAAAPVDAVCLGIGVNGHIAFNDPPADLDDPHDVRMVALDPVSRRQQVDDGGFTRIDDVPTHAVTLTVPRLLRASRLFCVVPGPQKRAAVAAALRGPIGPACPASALRRHPACTLYLDRDSAP